MRRTVITLIATVTSLIAAGQDSVWTGRVLDENGSPMPYATAVLFQMPDSTVIDGTTTGLDGIYRITTDRANITLMIEMVGYNTVWTTRQEAGDIKMELKKEALGAASVTAVMPKTTLTDQGMSTNIRGTVLENAGTANDALSKVPGMIKNKDGLEVVGKGAPLVYINGRKVNDSSELDRLQSNEIQSVEVINNPGPQYSASVRSVIRIKTIKHQGDGFGFNAGLNDQQSLRTGINDQNGYFKANFRHNGLDIFGGVNGWNSSWLQESYICQHTLVTPEFKQEGNLSSKGRAVGAGLNAGVNWQINDIHSVGFRAEGDIFPIQDNRNLIDENIYKGNVLTDHLLSDENSHNDNMPHYIKANAYYNGKAGKLGIDFNADWYRVKTSQSAGTDEKSEMEQDASIRYFSHSGNNMFATKLVLSYPVWKGSLQAGNENIFARRKEDYTISTNVIPSSASEVKEDEVAAFLNYSFYIPKVGSISAGLRYEHIGYDYTDILTGQDTFEKKYDNFFPSFSYANAFGPVQMQFSYSSKTRRPNFQSLSSAVEYHSRYIYESGNPKLQPQTDHELGLNVNWKFLTFVTQYSRTDNAISNWSELYNDDGVIMVKSINLDHPKRGLVAYVVATPTIGIWTLNYLVGMQQQWLELNGVSFSNRPIALINLNNTLTFKHDWQLELGAQFHSKGYTENVFLTNNYLDLNTAVQKSFFEKKLVLRLEWTDIAGLADFNLMTNCGSHIITQTNRMDTQRVKLSLKYNFNTAQSKYKGTGAGQSVAGRISAK